MMGHVSLFSRLRASLFSIAVHSHFLCESSCLVFEGIFSLPRRFLLPPFRFFDSSNFALMGWEPAQGREREAG